MTRRSIDADRKLEALAPGKPVDLRVGRTTVVTLPSGEEVVLEPKRDKGHLVLRITVPDGSQIDHRKNGTGDQGTSETYP